MEPGDKAVAQERRKVRTAAKAAEKAARDRERELFSGKLRSEKMKAQDEREEAALQKAREFQAANFEAAWEAAEADRKG